jgi:hypothetical protein
MQAVALSLPNSALLHIQGTLSMADDEVGWIFTSLPKKKSEQKQLLDFFGLTTFSLGMIGLQMLLDRGERMEWFRSAEICGEATASVLGFYLLHVHVPTAERDFLDKALFKDRQSAGALLAETTQRMRPSEPTR